MQQICYPNLEQKWVKKTDDINAAYATDKEIKFNTSML